MCDTGYLIKDHIHGLLQLISIELRGKYNMPMISTKCLHTAVMIMYLLLDTEGVSKAQECDTNIMSKRHSNSSHVPTNIECSYTFVDDIMESPGGELFYIMITDLTKEENDKYNFPGHVFVIEKTYDKRYNIYQSYIGFYTLSQYISNAKGVSVGHTKMRRFANNLHKLFTQEEWTRETSEFWSDFTKTPIDESSKFNGMDIQNRLFLCYRKVSITSCNNVLRSFVKRQIEMLENVPDENLDLMYLGDGHIDPNYRFNEFIPLTARQLKAEMITIMEKID